MKPKQPRDTDSDVLRRRAEKLVFHLTSNRDVSQWSPGDVKRLVHELEVHQTELELQNEELRRAQLELERSRDKYADLYDFSPVGYFTLDPRGVIREANLAGALLVQQERRALLHKPFSALVSENDCLTFYSHLRKVFESGSKQTCELELRGQGQEEIHVRLESIAFERTETEESVCRMAMSDITREKRVEQDVLEVQKQVLASMVEGVCLCDENGIISFTNPALDAMLGYEAGELSGRNLSVLEKSDPGQGSGLADMLKHAAQRGVCRGECACLKKDGSSLDIFMRIMLLNLFERKNVLVIWEDVTELRSAERNLLDSERRFRAIFESTTDLVYLKDRSLAYTQVNPAFERLLGQPGHQIVGLTHEGLFGVEGAAYERDVDIRVLGGQTIEEECTKLIGGIPVRFHEVRMPLRDSAGDVVGICGIARDVTERRARLLEPDATPKPPKSKAMAAVLKLARRVARQSSVVLLRGESGSGKDYLARYIHDHSDRSGGPFFSINCAAVSPDLAESELFGHERGSFTGAHARKRGLLELAEGGTLLLNEIGDLPLPLQAKLLTFLDTRKLLRVGAEKEIAVNARLIAATNKDLEAEVEAGGFRQDLYYRLSVMVVDLPPLRERIEDIPDLVRTIVGQLAKDIPVSQIPPIDAKGMKQLQHYQWPGNVRELKNVLERMLILGELPHVCDQPDGGEAGHGDFAITLHFGPGRTLRNLTDEITRAVCREALSRSHGNKKEAARILGIARDSLYRHIKHLEIDSPE